MSLLEQKKDFSKRGAFDELYTPNEAVEMILRLIFKESPPVSTGRCKTILIPSLNLGIINKSLSTITFCGIEKLQPFVFFLNLGNPAPLKNLLYASSRLMSADCKDWLLTSFNQGNSFFSSTSCFCKSYLDKFTLLPKYAVVFVSRARLYKNLTLPQCLCINSF